MFDVVIRKLDTLPLISRQVYLDGQPVDLTGWSFTFQVSSIAGTEIFNNAASLGPGDPTNDVQYQWTNADSGMVQGGTYFAVFKGTKGSDHLTFPNNRPLSLLVTDSGSWEYSYSGDPSARDIDKVRFLLGDKDMNNSFFTDSEITFILAENGGNAYLAGADLAMQQSGSFANLHDKTVGPLSIRYGEQASRWADVSKALRTRAGRMSGATAIFTGAASVARGPMFKIGMNDYPGSDLPIVPPEQGGILP